MDRDAAARELLGRSWAEAERHAADYVAEAEADVTRWLWVTDAGEHPEEPVPVLLEPLEVLDAEPGPTEREDTRQLGLDAHDEVRLVRYFNGGDDVFVEAVRLGAVVLRFVHHDGVVLGQLYHAVHDTEGRLTDVRVWNALGHHASHTEYHWDGQRPAFALEHTFHGPLRAFDQANSRSRTDYDYDQLGLVRTRLRVENAVAGEELADIIVWIRNPPGALEAAQALVEAELPARILAWVVRVAPFEPVAALALIVSADEPELPPRLALGTVAELRAVNAEHAGQDGHNWRLFSTHAFECWDAAPNELSGDAAFADACALLVQQWRRGNTLDAPLALLRECVRRLERLDWSEALRPPTIYVTVDDLSDEDALEHVQATVSAETIDALKALTT